MTPPALAKAQKSAEPFSECACYGLPAPGLTITRHEEEASKLTRFVNRVESSTVREFTESFSPPDIRDACDSLALQTYVNGELSLESDSVWQALSTLSLPTSGG